MNQQPDLRSILISVASLAKIAQKHLIGIGKPYEELIEDLVGYDIHDEDAYFPETNKEIYSKLDIKPNVYKKWLKMLYVDLQDLLKNDKPIVYELNGYNCFITARGRDKSHFYFWCRLPIVPRVGDGMDFLFLKSILGTTHFYVDYVTHECTDEQQSVIIGLEAGYYNAYSKMKEAEEKHKDFYGWFKRQEEE